MVLHLHILMRQDYDFKKLILKFLDFQYVIYAKFSLPKWPTKECGNVRVRACALASISIFEALCNRIFYWLVKPRWQPPLNENVLLTQDSSNQIWKWRTDKTL
jgi:hypothetical protein